MAQYEKCGVRCPFCGMPAHNGHLCHDDSRVYRDKDGTIKRVPPVQP